MSRTPSGPTSTVGAWAAFVVLAGLLAMHGLASHGSMDPGTPMTSMTSMTGTTATAATSVVAPARAAAQAPTTDDHGATGMPGTGSCVAVLGLLLLLVVLALRTGGTGWRVVAGRRLRLLTPVRARPPDPPDLWTLSVCRC